MKTGTFFLTLIGVIFLRRNGEAKCINKMSSATGTFSSPRHPYNYPSAYECDYFIKAPSGTYVEITFTKFKLEPPEEGKLTDYITVFDGREKNRQQEVVFDGSHRAPFKFLSFTSRVTVRFNSNDAFEFTGFKATYRAIKRLGCDPSLLVLDHGKAECDLIDNGLAKTCQVTCDDTYLLEGKSKIYCMGGSFFKPSSCVPDPLSHCNMSLVEKFNPVCEKDPTTGIVSSCNYTCEPNFFPVANGTVHCDDSFWRDVPKCFPDPELVDLCSEQPSSTKCPFTEQQTAEFVQAFFDEMNDLEELPSIGRDNSGGKSFKCKKILCHRKKNGEYYYQCQARSYKLQKHFKLSEEQRKEKMIFCFQCQNVNCNIPVKIFD